MTTLLSRQTSRRLRSARLRRLRLRVQFRRGVGRSSAEIACEKIRCRLLELTRSFRAEIRDLGFQRGGKQTLPERLGAVH
jgi:hypothetical protein